MAISLKLIAKEILMAGCKQVPFVGAAADAVDGISRSHETLHMQNRLQEIERGLTSFERRMRDLVKGEIEQTVQGLSRRDLSGTDFTNHIKNLYDIRQNGWSPVLFQGLLERSVHWNELCQNPAHYGSVLSDRQQLDPTKLQVFIDADKTRILELTPFALHGLLARQHDDTAQTKIVTSADVWAFVDGVTVKQENKPKPLSTARLVTDYARGQIGDVIEIPLTPSLKMKFAWVKPGTSWLGGGDGKPGQQQFTLDKGLWCGVYPVTQAEWKAVMGDDPSHFKDNPRHPVENVSWDRVQKEFLKTLKTKLGNSGLLFRLPTEEEWEYICRGGPISKDQSKYNFYFAKSKTDLTPAPTNDLSSSQANFDGNHPAGSAPQGQYRQATSEVDLFLPNPLGIYGLHGNVWEWTTSQQGSARVIRGGGWGSLGARCAASYRYWGGPAGAISCVGFRLLAVPVG